jgi:hypothetical protein
VVAAPCHLGEAVAGPICPAGRCLLKGLERGPAHYQRGLECADAAREEKKLTENGRMGQRRDVQGVRNLRCGDGADTLADVIHAAFKLRSSREVE